MKWVEAGIEIEQVYHIGQRSNNAALVITCQVSRATNMEKAMLGKDAARRTNALRLFFFVNRGRDKLQLFRYLHIHYQPASSAPEPIPISASQNKPGDRSCYANDSIRAMRACTDDTEADPTVQTPYMIAQHTLLGEPKGIMLVKYALPNTTRFCNRKRSIDQCINRLVVRSGNQWRHGARKTLLHLE
jgi:hypothetical protein